MSVLRQIALAMILVAGTAIAVSAYLDTQHGSYQTDGEVGAPILEFGSSYPMSRPLRASSRPVARDSRVLPTNEPSDRRQPRAIRSGGGVSIKVIRPISASFTMDEDEDCGPASAILPPVTH